MKLPLKRTPFSGSTESYIEDADGNDIARASMGYCKCGRTAEGIVAFPDATAERIVEAVNGLDKISAILTAHEWANDADVPAAVEAVCQCTKSLQQIIHGHLAEDEKLRELFDENNIGGSKEELVVRLRRLLGYWKTMKVLKERYKAKLDEGGDQ